MPHILTEHPLNLDEPTHLRLSAGARVVNITVQHKNGAQTPILVVRSDRQERRSSVARTFILVTPGQDVPEAAKYLGLLSAPWPRFKEAATERKVRRFTS